MTQLYHASWNNSKRFALVDGTEDYHNVLWDDWNFPDCYIDGVKEVDFKIVELSDIKKPYRLINIKDDALFEQYQQHIRDIEARKKNLRLPLRIPK